jgi:DNA transposition AAA+ family ATPase
MTLKQYIELRGINQNKLAIELGISRQLIGHKIKQGYLVGDLDGVMVMYNPSEIREIKKA